MSPVPAFAFPTPLSLQHSPVTKLPLHHSRPSSPLCSASPQNLPQIADRLRAELPTLFSAPNPDYTLYSPRVTFEDPLNKFRGTSRYKANINFLKNSPVFSQTSLSLYDTRVISSDTVRTRWALSMTAMLPWRPIVTFTGQSDYVADDAGLVVRHIDYWDSLRDSTFFAWQGVRDLLLQCAPAKVGVDLCGGFDLLRRTDEIQVRRFKGKGVTLKKTSTANIWTPLVANDDGSAETYVVTLAATRKIEDGVTGSAAEKVVRETLKGATFATAADRSFLVQVPIGGGRIVREVWVELSDANALVDGY